MTEKIHAFEQAGLGKAPFRYVGMEYQEIAYGQRVLANGATTKPGGTCDYCGTYIVNIYNIESADGKRFKVGCECVKKTGDAGLIKVVDRDRRGLERKRREAKRIAVERAAEDLCRATPLEQFAGTPHPMPQHAATGKTLADYLRWLIEWRYYQKAAFVIKTQLKETKPKTE